MTLENKRVLVVGLARSGVAALKVLKEKGAYVIANDSKDAEALGDIYDEITLYADALLLGEVPTAWQDIDLVVLSPGVPTDLPFLREAALQGVSVIGEVELAYRLSTGRFIGITGTNGKTTTTALAGEIFKRASDAVEVVGNIGLPVISRVTEVPEGTTFVTELSSFQLESVESFRPDVAAILNITPDHLNRHKTMTAYQKAKCQIFKNQRVNDVLVLNYDDERCLEIAKTAPSRIRFFSRKEALENGAFIEGGQLVLRDGEKTYALCAVDELNIVGEHNVENALAAALIAYSAGIEITHIRAGLKAFKGVRHRFEYVGTVDDRVFYNDSKATNPDAAICAVKATPKRTHLIAGGMDKGSNFSTWIQMFDGKIKSLVVLGETKHTIKETAEKLGFDAVYLVDDMAGAVQKAYELSAPGDTILLSPACASWDMYKDFEARGDDFVHCVEALRG
ncbi:UDP-N-acetylmuramoyl-L-alanine--D-glutamate ligase [Fusibacter sp. JL298sf-3]